MEEREAECRLCGRGTTLLGEGPCCEACEQEADMRAARLAETEWLEKWGAFEARDEDEEEVA